MSLMLLGYYKNDIKKGGLNSTLFSYFSRTTVIINVVPKLTEKEAIERSLLHIGASKYLWQDENEEQWIKNIKKDVTASFYPKGRLLICDYGKGDNQFALAYKFAIYASEPASDNFIYVDAISGDILRIEPISICINSTASAATKYSGTQTITTNNDFGQWRLSESGNRGIGLTTMNMLGGGSTSSAVNFTDNDNNWTSAEYNNANMDNAALDAHWGMEKTYDYFFNVHGRNGYSGDGDATLGFVHSNLGDNAKWVAQNLNWVLFGDGVTRFKPLTSLDIVAHEFGHGYTQFLVDPTGNSELSPGETQALNEGFSDIWGAVVENFSVQNKITWRIGEDIMKNGKPCLRSLENPNTGGDPAGSTTGGYPDTKGGTYWDSGNEPHTNSTVLSHWFYILSQGKTGTNDLGNFFNVQGIGITSAAKIVFRLEDVYLTQASIFNDVRNHAINSAIDLFCIDSKEVASVTNAWFAVGVGA